MRVFVTGATGFVGLAVTRELLAAGHTVLGLARSDEGAKALSAVGAEVHRGLLSDLDSLRSGASASDGVIHCAFNHDFSKFSANCEEDRVAIEALGSALTGSDRPLVVTSGIGPIARAGRLATEEDAPMPTTGAYPRASEQTAVRLGETGGVRSSVVRLPQVHDPVKQGFVSFLVEIARAKGVSAYVGDGSNQWSAGHVSDTARLYRLAVEKTATSPGQVERYHSVGEEGVALRDIAEAIGRGLKVPVKSIAKEEAGPHFGFLGGFVGVDMPASNALTKQRLGWEPTGPILLEDLAAMQY